MLRDESIAREQTLPNQGTLPEFMWTEWQKLH